MMKTTTFGETHEFNIDVRDDGTQIWWTEDQVDVPKFKETLSFTDAEAKCTNIIDCYEIFQDPWCERAHLWQLCNAGARFIAIIIMKDGKIIEQREYENVTNGRGFIKFGKVYGKVWTF